LKNFRPAKKILTKLQKFGENLDLRIRPHVLLKVLQDLRIWELCSPDIAVAIEVNAVPLSQTYNNLGALIQSFLNSQPVSKRCKGPFLHGARVLIGQGRSHDLGGSTPTPRDTGVYKHGAPSNLRGFEET
jgi:hypothetical protein